MANRPPVSPSTFQKALDAFKTNARLSKDEIADFQMTSLNDLKLQISIIQNDQRKSRKMLYLKRLGPFLDAMEQYGKIVEVFLNVSDFVAFVWGPMKFLLMVAKNYAEAFNALLEAYLEIGENIPQLSQYQQLVGTNPHMQLALASIYEDILDFHKEALRYFRQRTWKELFHATWRSFSNTVAHLIENLRRHKSLIESQASIIQFEVLQSLRTESKRRFEEQNMAELDRRRLSVQQWLCALDMQARQEDAAKLRYERTGQWLLNDPRFVKWYSFDYCAEPLLWLNGIPGAGKTVLASTVIQKCRELPEVRAGFFYCRHTDKSRSAFVSVARAILSQLVIGNEILVQYLYAQAANCGEVVLSSGHAAKVLLKTALQTCDKGQKTYIVIDGLDEYNREDRKEICTWFKEQVRNVPTHELGAIRCLFISQDDGYARKDLSDCSSIELTTNDIRQDIEAYCKMWHQLIAQKFGPLDPKAHNITEIITARAQGMFLYAKLVAWNLHEQPNRKKFLEEIRPDRLPDGLEQAYARIIERIIGPDVHPESRRDNAKTLLGWLACAKRTLKWHEIQGAVSIDLDDGTMSPDLHFRDDCKDICASLVDVSSDGSVVLVHSTAKRYLIEKEHVCVSEVEFHLAHLCLAYLSFDQFLLGTSQAGIQDALCRGDYAFADYASCFWALHLIAGVREGPKLPSGKTKELVEAIDVFLEVQWASPTKTLVVSKTVQDSLLALATYDFYDKICQAVVSTKNQLLPTGKGPSDDEALHLAKVIQAIREELETIGSAQSTTPAGKKALEQFYGSNWYKCRRINCQFYSQGFPAQLQRDHHISKHERSFICTEEGCLQAVIGCATAKELQMHMKDYHGTEFVADPTYPEDEPEPEADARRSQNHRATFECNQCPKRFTRAYNLRSHLRTHNNERPFTCGKCRKSFTRRADYKRHESTHGWEGRFICRGVLKDGKGWGCGRQYSRAEALSQHFKSKVGRVCNRPLLDEEAAEKGHSRSSEEVANKICSPTMFPHNGWERKYQASAAEVAAAANLAKLNAQHLVSDRSGVDQMPWVEDKDGEETSE